MIKRNQSHTYHSTRRNSGRKCWKRRKPLEGMNSKEYRQNTWQRTDLILTIHSRKILKKMLNENDTDSYHHLTDLSFLALNHLKGRKHKNSDGTRLKKNQTHTYYSTRRNAEGKWSRLLPSSHQSQLLHAEPPKEGKTNKYRQNMINMNQTHTYHSIRRIPVKRVLKGDETDSCHHLTDLSFFTLNHLKERNRKITDRTWTRLIPTI